MELCGVAQLFPGFPVTTKRKLISCGTQWDLTVGDWKDG